MTADLIITNGDTAAAAIRALRDVRGAHVLAWRDILYEGPVNGAGDFELLSKNRARYLAERGYGHFDALMEDIAARDSVLRAQEDFAQVTLWFEHDLCDQLQLLQVLDFFAREAPGRPGLFLIQAARFIALEPPKRLAAQLSLRRPVAPPQLEMAARAWRALCQPNPVAWGRLSESDTDGLPFLRPAIRRHLEELPERVSGLSRTERTLLGIISNGIRRPPDIFEALQDAEEASFMSDWSVYKILDELAHGNAPLIEGLQSAPFTADMTEDRQKRYLSSELRLTEFGQAAITSGVDTLAKRQIDRWFGGTRIISGHVWRWDEKRRQLVAP